MNIALRKRRLSAVPSQTCSLPMHCFSAFCCLLGSYLVLVGPFQKSEIGEKEEKEEEKKREKKRKRRERRKEREGILWPIILKFLETIECALKFWICTDSACSAASQCNSSVTVFMSIVSLCLSP